MEVGQHIKPLSIGDMLDLALRLYRRHFRAFFLIMLVMEIPIFVLQRAFSGVMESKMPASVVAGGEVTPELIDGILLVAAVLPGVVLAMTLLLTIAQAAVTLGGERAYHGHEVSLLESYRRTWDRGILVLLGTELLLLLGLALGSVLGSVIGGGIILGAVATETLALGVVGAGVALVGAIGTPLWLMLHWYLVIPTLILEKRSPLAAFRRSAQLMSGTVERGVFGQVKIRASILLLVVFVLLMIPQLLLQIPTLMLASAYSTQAGVMDISLVPMVFRLPLEVAQLTLGAVLRPFGILATVVLYFDLRIRKEGYDLELRAQALGEAV